ncbi:diphthine--ammonia ligase [Candidatus Woesearchaeota archaeon]|nr:diphthine--ammonia ligase [Candidatus Woesearchaeota archaeon]
MKLGILFSGGKDSNYALFKANKSDEVTVLISLDSKNEESYMFHTPIEEVDKQAKRLGIPLIKIKTEGEKEKELEDLKKAIKEAKKYYAIEGIVTGAVASTYQASRIQRICDELDLWCFNPLWQMNQERLLRDLIKNRFKFKIVKVAADGLDDSWINKIIDKKAVEDLIRLSKKYRFNVAFEGGEAETEVIDSPMFKK